MRTWSVRLVLFLLTNLAVVGLLGTVLTVLGVDALLLEMGTPLPALLLFAGALGFGGSLISLALSKRLALWSTGAHVIGAPRNPVEAWLVSTVHAQARAVGIDPPDVAIYDSPEPNAFATGARRNAALVAVSTGLLRRMDRPQVEAVLAHEVSHVANGDMVTLALLQGVVNTFVVLLARVAGLLVDRAISGDRHPGPAYWITTLAAEMGLGLVATAIVMAFSRHREFRADAGAADLVGAGPMIGALRALADRDASRLPEGLAAFGIRPRSGGLARWFSSHPPLQDRIRALEKRRGRRHSIVTAPPSMT